MNGLLIGLSLCCTQGPDLWASQEMIRMDAALSVRFRKDLERAFCELRQAHGNDPSDNLVFEGICLIRANVCYPSANGQFLHPESEWYPGWLYSPTMIVFSFFAWCIICASLTRWYQVRRRHWLIIAGIMVPLALVPPINEWVRHLRLERDRIAPPVVISTDTDLFAGNGREYESKAKLPRCVECRKIGERGDWLQVEFASGLTGWVEKHDAIVATD